MVSVLKLKPNVPCIGKGRRHLFPLYTLPIFQFAAARCNLCRLYAPMQQLFQVALLKVFFSVVMSIPLSFKFNNFIILNFAPWLAGNTHCQYLSNLTFSPKSLGGKRQNMELIAFFLVSGDSAGSDANWQRRQESGYSRIITQDNSPKWLGTNRAVAMQRYRQTERVSQRVLLLKNNRSDQLSRAWEQG